MRIFGGMRTSPKSYIMLFLEKLISLLLESIQFVLWKCCDPIQNIFIKIPNLTCDFFKLLIGTLNHDFMAFTDFFL